MFCALLIILNPVVKLLCSENLHVKGKNITKKCIIDCQLCQADVIMTLYGKL